MIHHLRGTLVAKAPGTVVLECAGGVGFALAVSGWTLARLPAVGEEAELFCHLVLRDDQAQLYGFASASERQLFLLLQGVQGVGPRLALAVLSAGGPDELARAIASGARERFLAVPGVGKRTAERIIVELRERAASELAHTPTSERSTRGVAHDETVALVRDGLAALGFEGSELERLVDAALSTCGSDASVEELVASALRAARAAA
ncbi:MAG: Holliday junction branch migration protein RuvA [Thermoleophilum sp.]|nr:Holliday junction branch migration protein RuvA [Thermoleophilum sp.]